MTETIESMPTRTDQQQFAQALVEQARWEGVELIGPGGLLTGLTKTVLETALEAEITDHLGYDKHDPMGRSGQNSRNGPRPKTVLTEIGPIEIEVPRDRDGTFEPGIVRKRQRRLDGVDQIILSLSARGLTTGEIAAHFAEVYGATVTKDPNRPVYVAIGVTCNGERDILGLWAGDGGEGAKFWLSVLTETKTVACRTS